MSETIYRIFKRTKECDFCSYQVEEGNYRSFDATDYVAKDSKTGKDLTMPAPAGEEARVGLAGEWLACPVCAAFIDADQWDRLTERSTNHFMILHDIPESRRADVRKALEFAHAEFRNHRAESRAE